MVEWLAGNRIRGTSTERTTSTGFNPVPAGVDGIGGWKELGRTTLGSAGQKILINSIADKRYLMILTNMLANGTNDLSCGIRFNEDIGSNYARRDSFDGASDGSAGSLTSTATTGGITIDNQVLGVHYVSNLSAKEKLLTGHYNLSNATGAATIPNRGETVGKWANTSAVIDDVEQVTGDSGFGTGSEVVVLGWDPDDTHTTNFWEQLGSADWVSGTSLPTVSFTAKKYLWVQCFTSGGIGGDGANRVSVRVGNGSIDTGNNYAFRNSENGGTDSTSTSTNRWLTHTGNKKNFTNMFIVNNSANEKLAMYHTSESSGTGASSNPSRIEGVGKWANTSSQINRISVFDYTGGNSFNAGTIKVWGHD